MTLSWCDGCQRDRHDVQSCGRDANGDPDAPDLCFICRVEDRRGRCYSQKHKGYVPYALLEAEAIEAEYQRTKKIK